MVQGAFSWDAPPRCLVVGAGGLLGSTFVSMASERGWTVEILRRDRVVVEQARVLKDAVISLEPDVVVNCAAHTDVERAETEIGESFKVNALLPGILAEACRECDAVLTHISSTGCYGDWKNDLYMEFDPLRPTTVHHLSKAQGEILVGQKLCRALILRTGWLYGGTTSQTRNFVWQRLKEAVSSPQLLSDAGQRGNPTNVSDVAMQMLHLIESGITGTFNCVAQGSASRFEYVKSIVEFANLDCRVMAAPAGHFARRAPVSANEAASNFYLNLLGLDLMPDWETALRRYVGVLMPDLKELSGRPHG